VANILQQLTQSSAYCERTNARVLYFSGPDHLRYLHNRLTQDVKGLQEGHWARTLCLSPNGRVAGEFLLLKESDAVWLVSNALPSTDLGDEMKQAVLQFKVADQLECTDLSASFGRVLIIGQMVPVLLAMIGIDLSGSGAAFAKRELFGSQMRILASNRAGLPAVEVIASNESLIQLRGLAANVGIQELSEGDAEALRLLSGSWRFGVDVDDKTLAPELELEDYVSFKKGCYPGQEVVEMSIARGRPNRKLCILSAEGEVATGAEVLLEGKSVGVVTSSAPFPDNNRSLFFSRLKVEALESSGLVVNGTPCSILTLEEAQAKLRDPVV
jgi:folate-binding protein YgfZ